MKALSQSEGEGVKYSLGFPAARDDLFLLKSDTTVQRRQKPAGPGPGSREGENQSQAVKGEIFHRRTVGGYLGR